MKRFAFIPAFILSLMIAMPAASFAAPQTKEPYCRIKPPKGKVDPARAPRSHEATEAEMFRDLDLSDAQIAKVKKLNDDKKSKADKRCQKAKKEIQKEREKYLSQMKKVLTPAQFAKFKEKYVEARKNHRGNECQPGQRCDSGFNSAPAPGSVGPQVAGPKRQVMTH